MNIEDKKVAFTLAEVLITLGIIGIVAAMTLPALIQNYKKHEASARLKKFNTTLNQVMMFSENDNGPSIDWARNGDILDEAGNLDWNANFSEQRRFFEKYFAPYMEYVDIKDGETDVDEEGAINVKSHVTVYFKDGSSMHLYNGGAFDMIFDINGNKRPNKVGYDQFNFEVSPESYARMFFPENHNFGTRRVIWDRGNFTRDAYLGYCKDNALYCARLLELDNWEFKKDYPYKL